MKARSVSLIGIALAAVICATPAFAHGWPVPLGGGAPSFGGPAGGGGGNNGVTGGGGNNGVMGGGGAGSEQGPEFGGAVGGGNPNAGPAAGGAPHAGATGGSRGAAVTATKGKGGATPWMSRAGIPWTPAFLPTIAVSGYAARTGTIADALRLEPSDGGWVRDQRPIMVFSYDATNAEHRRILATLDADSRVRAAAWFFNCFRVDAGAAPAGKSVDARLSLYTADGTLVGELVGQRKLSSVFDLMEAAWQKQGRTDLTNKVAKMDGFLKTRAYAEYFVPLCEVGIVCPDCGHERHDVLERIAELKARIEACDRAIDELRTLARN